MNKAIIILAAVIFCLPLDAFAYKGHKGKQGPKNEFRQEIKSKVQEHRQEQKTQNRDFRKSLERTTFR